MKHMSLSNLFAVAPRNLKLVAKTLGLCEHKRSLSEDERRAVNSYLEEKSPIALKLGLHFGVLNGRCCLAENDSVALICVDLNEGDPSTHIGFAVSKSTYEIIVPAETGSLAKLVSVGFYEGLTTCMSACLWDFCTQPFQLRVKGLLSEWITDTQLASTRCLPLVGDKIVTEYGEYEFSSEGTTLWWREWGGELYAINCNDWNVKSLGANLGDRRRLPISEVR